MTDRHGPLILAANLAGIAAIAILLVWLALHPPAGPTTPRVAPISSITPTDPAGR